MRGNKQIDGGGVSYPASHADVMAVSSIDPGNVKSYFSSSGADVELCAPGNWVYTSKLGGGYSNASGTSFSAPFAAGVGALYKQLHPGFTVSQLRAAVKAAADNIGLPPAEQGSGRVDCTETD